MPELAKEVESKTDVSDNGCESAHNSMSSSTYGHGTLEYKSLLQEQYLLLQESRGKIMRKNVYCCSNEKTRPWLLRITFLIIVGLGLTVSYFEVRFSTYSSKRLSLISGDQMLVPLSTYFIKQVKFHANSNDSEHLKLHVLRNKPNVSSEIVSYKSGVKFHMPSWTYQYWGFHLLEGTSVRIFICTDLQIQFYIIRGERKLEKWTQQILYNGYDYHKNIFPKQSCESRRDFTIHDLTIESSDTYYILFSSSAGWRFYTSVSLLLVFNRTYYDLSNAKYVCTLSNVSCVAILDEGSTDIALLETVLPIEETVHHFHTMNVRHESLPRHEFYVKLFGGIYLTVLVLSAIYVVWRTVVNRSDSNYETKPLLSDKFQQGYSTTNPGDKKWVIVSQVSDDEALCRVEEKDARALFTAESGESINSRKFMEYQNELPDYAYRNEYNNTQQLMDVCLSSTGASAI